MKHAKVVNNSGCVGMPEKWRRLESIRCSGCSGCSGRNPLPLRVATLREGRRSHHLQYSRTTQILYLLNNSGKLNDSWRKRFLPSVETTASFVIPNECDESRFMVDRGYQDQLNSSSLLSLQAKRSEAIPDITRLLRRNAPRNDNLLVAGPTSI